MALFYECTLMCARKLLDAADIVREAMLRPQPSWATTNASAFVDLPTHSSYHIATS